MERLAAPRVERREELVLELLDDPGAGELPLARGRDADHVAAPVVRVALALDQAALLERVEQPTSWLGSSVSASAIVACVSRAPSSRIARTL